MYKIAPPSAFKINPVNPRKITADQLSRLKKSLQELPQMLELRPIVVDNDHSMTVLGGNMRVLAARELGIAELPYVTADNLTDEQKQRFIIADNVSFGEWEQELLNAYWDTDQLVDWGVDIPQADDHEDHADNIYTQKVTGLIYEPSTDEPPAIGDLSDVQQYNEKLELLRTAESIPEATKQFLMLAASRFIAFDYQAIADYYAAATQQEKELFVALGLVIVDMNAEMESAAIAMQQMLLEHADA